MHPAGAIYHLKYKPPPPEVVDRLVQRSDDTEEKVRAGTDPFGAVQVLCLFHMRLRSSWLPGVHVQTSCSVECCAVLYCTLNASSSSPMSLCALHRSWQRPADHCLKDMVDRTPLHQRSIIFSRTR